MMSTESLPSYVTNLVRMLSNWITWFPYDFQVQVQLTRHAESWECWIIDFLVDSISSYHFGYMIKLSSILYDLSANMTKIVCKCRIYIDSSILGFLLAYSHPYKMLSTV